MKFMHLRRSFLLTVAFSLTYTLSFGQANPITTATPFLTITPDTRSGALGDAGVAISPDANSTYWNPAKLPFAEKDYGVALNYAPWLKFLIGDMSFSHLSGYYRLKNKSQVIGGYMTYFNLGGIQFRETATSGSTDFRPNEFTIAATGSQKLSDNMGLSVTLRYIHSNLAGNYTFKDGIETTTKPGNTASGDVAFYYFKDLKISAKDIRLAFGANLSNLGAKISYSSSGNREFLPTNLKIGTAVTYNADAFNKFTFTVDFNKLMVPTPTATSNNSTKSYLSGVLGSFGDAPGGFKEEMKEINICSGVEYWYNDAFAVRAGYFRESPDKGNRRYLTVGAGFRYQAIGADFAYLIPAQQNNPLSESLRFSVHFNLNGKFNLPDAPPPAQNDPQQN
jgi:hypothetical protein